MAAPSNCGPSGMEDCASFPGPPYSSSTPPRSTYVVNSKIMVVAIAVLFGVVAFILCLHVYAKWFWRNQGALGATGSTLRTASWRRRRRAASPDLGSNTNPATTTNPLVVQSVGLEKTVIAALPAFEFDSKVGPLECAVCLEDFEDGEKGRTLPKCGHHFHLDCVDMWLHSHSTCPLCRASVRPQEEEKGAAAEPRLHLPDAPVIGDVHAPFMAAMRASRRHQRFRNPPSHTGVVPSDNLPMENPPTESSATSEPYHEATTTASTPVVDPKALALQYETPATGIPANVLFWGNQMTTTGAQPSASQQLPIRVPFQVTIDIPGGSSQSAGVVMSPMARASASFRRLLSRGKSVVSPQEDGHDEGGPSTSPHLQLPPSPPPPNHTS